MYALHKFINTIRTQTSLRTLLYKEIVSQIYLMPAHKNFYEKRLVLNGVTCVVGLSWNLLA